MIRKCLSGDRLAQKYLYDLYAPVMLATCRRYIASFEDAEDVMIEGYYKVFEHLSQYDYRGSFEGWIKKIMVNEALMWLRKRKLRYTELNESMDTPDEDFDLGQIEVGPSAIFEMLDQLPEGYRTIFNLYVIEEYKHKEIAELLGISINTSKSQLILAKKRLKNMIEASNQKHKKK
mgnify:CR=1 FL=1